MLPKNLRLPSAEFRKVKKFGRNELGKFFLVSYWKKGKRDDREGVPPTTLFGFVVSKSLDKKAVGRNRIRRRLSESVRLFVKDRGSRFRATPGVGGPILSRVEGLDSGSPGSQLEVCFIAHKSILGRSYAEVSFEVDKVLSKILEL